MKIVERTCTHRRELYLIILIGKNIDYKKKKSKYCYEILKV